MAKHMFVAVFVYMLVFVGSAPLYSVGPPCGRYPFTCLPQNIPASYIVSNINYEEVQEEDNETVIILSTSSNNILINYMKRQVSGNTPYSREDAADTSFEIQDANDSDYDDGDSYEIWETYDVGDDDDRYDQADNYDSGESFDDGLFFDDGSTY